MEKDLLLPTLKLKYQTLHQPHCSQIKTGNERVKDEKLLYLRRAKMNEMCIKRI
jgi:hypothetical protein